MHGSGSSRCCLRTKPAAGTSLPVLSSGRSPLRTKSASAASESQRGSEHFREWVLCPPSGVNDAPALGMAVVDMYATR
jgi:hypothetical protein